MHDGCAGWYRGTKEDKDFLYKMLGVLESPVNALNYLEVFEEQE